MDKKYIQDTALKHAPTKYKWKHAGIAFLSGGTLAVIVQAFMLFLVKFMHVHTNTAISISIVSVILITAIATGIGVYDKLAQRCGAGLFIPITGFANSLTSCALEGKSEGFIYGIGGMMFKLAGSVLTYGITAAFVFGMIRYLLFGA